MDERWKDRVEAIGAIAVEAGISAIPGVGGPVAVIANRAFALKDQQRTQRILSQFEEDIEELKIRGNAQTAFLDSEEFLAGLHVLVRAANETSSESKRTLLRNALLNEYVVREPRKYPPQFVRLIAAYQAEHVELLNDLASVVAETGRVVENPAWKLGEIAKDAGRPADPFLKNFLDDLVRDGLIGVSEESQRDARPPVYPRTYATVSQLGHSFLQYVKSPSGG